MIKQQEYDFAGKHVLVLGLAKSGEAAAKLLLRLGARVTINERGERDAFSQLDELEQMGIRVVCGGHPFSLLDEEIALIVKNPGIPFDIPFLQEAEKREIPIVTEVELGYVVTKAPIIGITGSNGKTTTTTLIYEMLQGSKRTPLIAGNIGTVFCEVAEKAGSDQWLVTELSSFQLLGTRLFQPQISLILNIYDAHLDYHHTKEHYVAAKCKVFMNQSSSQLKILNYDQAITRSFANMGEAQVAWFSMKEQVPRGAYLDQSKVMYRDQHGATFPILPLADIRLMGEYNLENSLAAVVAAMEAGAELDRIREVLQTFTGVAHRLQFVRELDGVHYYNNSKATNALATLKAIQAFRGSIILIAGGLDRGEDLSLLEDVFRSHLRGIVIYGQIADQLGQVAQLAGVKQVVRVDNVKEAVSSAYHMACSGDIVLLSPAAASWDQFRSFEERGDMFTHSVHMLR